MDKHGLIRHSHLSYRFARTNISTLRRQMLTPHLASSSGCLISNCRLGKTVHLEGEVRQAMASCPHLTILVWLAWQLLSRDSSRFQRTLWEGPRGSLGEELQTVEDTVCHVILCQVVYLNRTVSLNVAADCPTV